MPPASCRLLVAQFTPGVLVPDGKRWTAGAGLPGSAVRILRLSQQPCSAFPSRPGLCLCVGVRLMHGNLCVRRSAPADTGSSAHPAPPALPAGGSVRAHGDPAQPVALLPAVSCRRRRKRGVKTGSKKSSHRKTGPNAEESAERLREVPQSRSSSFQGAPSGTGSEQRTREVTNSMRRRGSGAVRVRESREGHGTGSPLPWFRYNRELRVGRRVWGIPAAAGLGLMLPKPRLPRCCQPDGTAAPSEPSSSSARPDEARAHARSGQCRHVPGRLSGASPHTSASGTS